MTYTTYRNPNSLIPPHGGYRKLVSFQMAEIVFDYNQEFTEKYIKPTTRTFDQRIQAGRSGKQNIAEASVDSGTSKKSELKLLGVARGSMEELLLDTEDYLRRLGLPLWGKDDPRVKEIRGLAYRSYKTYTTYKSYLDASPEIAANCLICLIHQTNFLLDRQLKALSEEFLEKGGFTERLYNARKGGK